MASTDSPAFQFYPADYLSDTEWLTPSEEAAYVRLLCHCWRGSAPGCRQGQLPSDIALLRGLAKNAPAKTVAKVIDLLFERDGDVITHKRITAELRGQKERRNKRSEAGKAGADARWDDGKRMANAPDRNAIAMANDGPSPSPASSPPGEEEPDSSEPAKPPPSEPPVMTFPCSGRVKTWDLTHAQLGEWAECYPGLDVRSECLKALAWAKATSKRKTARGTPRFLVNWLNRATDSGRSSTANGRASPPAELPKPRGTATLAALAAKNLEIPHGDT